MLKGFIVRIFPTQEQEEKIWKHINGSRFVWNYAIEMQEKRYNIDKYFYGKYELRKIIQELTKQSDYNWLKEISTHTIGLVCELVYNSYLRFFNGISQKPHFKSKKKDKPSYFTRAERTYFNNNETVHIEKVGNIKFKTNYSLPRGMKNCKLYRTGIKYRNGKWLLFFSMDCENQTVALNDYKIGIDVGVKRFATIACSDSSFYCYNNINYSKRIKALTKKLKHLSRNLNRKYQTNNKNHNYDCLWYKSNNIIKLEAQIRKIYSKINNIKRDFIHKVTHDIVSMRPKSITIEDLDLIGIEKNKHLAKCVADQYLSEFKRQIEYKSEKYGIELIKADRFYPSSKTCSRCGCIKPTLKLYERTFVCNECGFEIDRDLNAAINLMNYSTT